MAERYFWLKLKENFFETPEIKVVEGKPNGEKYIVFYFKLLCKGISSNGMLRLNEAIPYDEEMLALITNTDIDVVRTALSAFIDLKLIEVLDDKTLFLTKIQGLVGSETDYAVKKREYREKIKQKDNVRELSYGSPIDIDKEKEQEKDIDKELELDSDSEENKKGKKPWEDDLPF